jgi:hypothetical protein
MSETSDYRVTFSALSARPLVAGELEALRSSLASMPGIDGVDTVSADADAVQVTAAFWIEVRLGMADAARDGSRLAKEALKVARLADTHLVELSVSLRRP